MYIAIYKYRVCGKTNKFNRLQRKNESKKFCCNSCVLSDGYREVMALITDIWKRC